MPPFVRLVSSVVVACALVSCASSPPPVRVKAADLRSLDGSDLRALDRPVIVELAPGDTIPIDVGIDGDLVQSAEPRAPIVVTVRERFFVEISKRGIRTSRDGTFRDAPASPGSLAFGLGLSRERGLRASISVRMPGNAR
jgi:hypothetical protein